MEWQEGKNALCCVLYARDFTLQGVPITQRNRPKQVRACDYVCMCLSSVFNQIYIVCADISPTVSCQLTSATVLIMQTMKMLQPSEWPVISYFHSTDVITSMMTYLIFVFRSRYSCLDARFYDDDMLTVVLQGAEDNSRRVLAQLPLTSTLSCETEFTWEPNFRCVFNLFHQGEDVTF